MRFADLRILKDLAGGGVERKKDGGLKPAATQTGTGGEKEREGAIPTGRGRRGSRRGKEGTIPTWPGQVYRALAGREETGVGRMAS